MIWNSLRHWLNGCARGKHDHTSASPRSCTLTVERLEDRCCPSTVYALTSSNHLLSFDSADPGTILSDTRITGVQGNIVGIDFRPETGELFALTRTNLYTIDTTSGEASKVGEAKLDPAPQGGRFGFDFNPTVDRIRVVSNTGQNLRLNPITGGLASEDADLNFAAADTNAGQKPRVEASAYTNNDRVAVTATGTILYGIDSKLDILVTQNPPNDGVLNTVGSLGVDVNGQVSFDIFSEIDPGTGAATSNTAFAAFNRNEFYTINLTSGVATLIGEIDSNVPIKGIAVTS